MAYSLNSSSDHCYEGTNCLINKLDIRDDATLSKIEARISFAKAAMLEDEPIQGDFGFEHFKKIHEFLFCDLYEWAGTVRTVDISKKRTRFLEATEIESVAKRCFERVTAQITRKGSFDEFVGFIAELYHDINYIHPFREGNGRAQRAYFSQLIRYCGYEIDFSATDTDELMIATVLAAQGMMEPLTDFFKGAIRRA